MKYVGMLHQRKMTTRVEKAGKQSVPAISIQLAGLIHASKANGFFSSEGAAIQALSPCWKSNGTLANPDIDTLAVKAEMTGGVLVLAPDLSGAEHHEFTGVGVNKVTMKLVPNLMVEITVNVNLKVDDPDALWFLFQKQDQDLRVILQPAQTDAFQEPLPSITDDDAFPPLLASWGDIDDDDDPAAGGDGRQQDLLGGDEGTEATESDAAAFDSLPTLLQ